MKRKQAEWPFPSVIYDYEAAGVGTKTKPIPLDREELDAIARWYRTTTKVA